MREDLVNFDGIKNTSRIVGPVPDDSFWKLYLGQPTAGVRHRPRKTARATVARAIASVIVDKAQRPAGTP